jgi:hypothetical protein
VAGSIAAPVIFEAAEADRGDALLVGRSSGRSVVTLSRRGTPAVGHPCGDRTDAVVAGVDAQVAQKIYADELAGRETRIDQAHVRGSRALSGGLSTANAAAIYTAVHGIVYTPGWHIVRLRVVETGHVVADVGGPYVIAPVVGVLRRHGHAVGRYVMSVQDDVGFVKLITRFIGVPVDLYRGQSFLMGMLRPAPVLPAHNPTIAVVGRDYRVELLDMRAFPNGALKVALFAPAPPRSLASLGCERVLAYAWGSIARHIAARFTPLSAHVNDLTGLVRAVTGASLFVVSGGREIAGGKLPGNLATSATLRIAGRTRAVFSWLPPRGCGCTC